MNEIILKVKVQDFGVNAIAAGQVGETIYLYSGSLFGELVRKLKTKTSHVDRFDQYFNLFSTKSSTR